MQMRFLCFVFLKTQNRDDVIFPERGGDDEGLNI